MSSYIA